MNTPTLSRRSFLEVDWRKRGVHRIETAEDGQSGRLAQSYV
jgi:hypothetical protein